MALAAEQGLASLAFPAISTGVYGYPLPQATEIAVAGVRAAPAGSVRRVIFACFDAGDRCGLPGGRFPIADL